jgi:hypothetical protein
MPTLARHAVRGEPGCAKTQWNECAGGGTSELPNGGCHKEVRKQFFFEKKNQKTFVFKKK